MGLAAGGRMRQEIYLDPYGFDTWNEDDSGRVFVHIVNSMMFREITGEEPPPTPISARSYTEAGLPWFELYDEAAGDVERSEKLAAVNTVKEMDLANELDHQQDDSPVPVSLPRRSSSIDQDSPEWIDTRNEDRDNHLRSSDFFDAENNPTMIYRTRSLGRADDDLVVEGDLTIKNVTKPVTLAVEFSSSPPL